MNTSAHVIAPFVYSGLTFDMLRDFSGIGPIALLPNVLIVAPQRRWKSLQDLIDAARAKPGGYTYATGGSGTGTHMSAERFRLRAALDAVQVPTRARRRSCQRSYPAASTGRSCPCPPWWGTSGTAHTALALSAEHRSPQLPELPTLTEAGLDNADFPFWVGMFVPVKTPAAARRRLYEETTRAMQQADVRERLTKAGAEIVFMTPDAFDTYVKAQADIASVIVKAANIRAN